MLENYEKILEKSKNNKIDNEILKTLALFSPEAKDLRVVIAHLKIVSELTRISDRSVNIVKLAYFAQEGGKLKL